ncbi:MAG: hypothetical protein KAH32_04440, partial [Chlamydiia bacterium]|nr:hypothetical protein [Chlamydiia bacterium]
MKITNNDDDKCMQRNSKKVSIYDLGKNAFISSIACMVLISSVFIYNGNSKLKTNEMKLNYNIGKLKTEVSILKKYKHDNENLLREKLDNKRQIRISRINAKNNSIMNQLYLLISNSIKR